MLKFFWTAIATILVAFLFHNISADDNTSNTPVSVTDNSISNVPDHSELPVEREPKPVIKTEEAHRDTPAVLPVGWPAKESRAGAWPVEVKSTEPTFNIKQTEDEHVQQGNGSMYAVDLTTSTWNVYFPKGHNEYVIHFVGEDTRLGNYVIIRHDTSRWLFGHTVTSRDAWSYVKTTASNNVLWQYNRSWISTGPHVHIERWDCPAKDSRMKDCENVSSTGEVAPRNKELKEQRGWVEEDKWWLEKIQVGWEVRVIACLNEKNMTIHPAKNSGSTGCFLWNGWAWKNIMLPPQKDLDLFKKTFWDDFKYRLAIANFDGAFNENTENNWAKWYLQTLKSHNVPPDIVSQLNWLAKREIGNTWPACDKYLSENFTLFGTMNVEAGKIAKYTCMWRRHFWAFSPGDEHYPHSVMYAKRYKVTTEHYLSLNF